MESILPREWVLRPYHPDYGIDFSLEVFKRSGTDKKGKPKSETLGEHLFIQLKSSTKPKRKSLPIYERLNVEKYPEEPKPGVCVAKIETIPYSVETSELVTIQRMGAAVPVLLVLADLFDKSCYFVCLNDYIDKILVPKYGDYTKKDSHTIYIPTHNALSNPATDHIPLRWYAKRPKLYAGFQKFFYQQAELHHAFKSPEYRRLAHYFANKITNYDFWDDTEIWQILAMYGKEVRQFLKTGSAGKQLQFEGISHMGEEEREGLANYLADVGIAHLWDRLSLLSRNYEEIQREWFLPTALGYHTSLNGR